MRERHIDERIYILFAGVNGAGKSVFSQTMPEKIAGMSRVNIDEIVKSFGDWRDFNDMKKAASIAVKRINDNFSRGKSFNQETTLCGASILKNIRKAKELGYRIIVYYIGVDSADIAKERVRKRVKNGGHDIPDKDIERRYTESIRRLREIIPICDEVTLYDNTKTFHAVAVYKNGKLLWAESLLPVWCPILK